MASHGGPRGRSPYLEDVDGETRGHRQFETARLKHPKGPAVPVRANTTNSSTKAGRKKQALDDIMKHREEHRNHADGAQQPDEGGPTTQGQGQVQVAEVVGTQQIDGRASRGNTLWANVRRRIGEGVSMRSEASTPVELRHAAMGGVPGRPYPSIYLYTSTSVHSGHLFIGYPPHALTHSSTFRHIHGRKDIINMGLRARVPEGHLSEPPQPRGDRAWKPVCARRKRWYAIR
jgi:hypothetical protein